MLNLSAFEDRRTSEGRLVGLRAFFAVTFAGLVVVFWILQVLQNAKYEGLADSNYLRTIPLRAPRGVLFDRHGKVLVENRHSFTIAVLREATKDLNQTIQKIASATGVPETAIREAIERRRREPLFRPLPVIEHATFEQVAAVEVRRRELPEVLVQQVPTRNYPPDRMAAHLFGYVGEIQEAQLAQAEFSELSQGAIIGQAGVERTYNRDLQGVDGDRYVVVNSRGREIDELNEVAPVDGRRLQLTIDYDVQKALEDSFRAGNHNGAAAFLDPRTGEILAMTSLPAFDPNAFAVGINGSAWSQLLADPLRPLTNRLIQGTYSPGSTFKIVMAVAGLMDEVITPETTFFCPGQATFYGRAFRCLGRHGSVDLRHAIERSCNIYFYNVGQRLGIDAINKYATMLGLTGKTGIDLPNEEGSLVPSTEWARLYRKSAPKWYPGETISVAIGQGAVSVTPMSLATMIATVANGGSLVTPHLVRAVDEGAGWVERPVAAPKHSIHIPPNSMQAIRDGLWAVVNGEAGTARRSKVPGRDVSGKTGTSQVVSLERRAQAARAGMDVRDHGFFVFFAPRDNPEIAGVVFAEHGAHGSDAAFIAKHAIETYFAKRDGLPLPVLTPPGAPAPVRPAPAPPQVVAQAPASVPVPGPATQLTAR
jgi:penicillin-binding protein 2